MDLQVVLVLQSADAMIVCSSSQQTIKQLLFVAALQCLLFRSGSQWHLETRSEKFLFASLEQVI